MASTTSLIRNAVDTASVERCVFRHAPYDNTYYKYVQYRRVHAAGGRESLVKVTTLHRKHNAGWGTWATPDSAIVDAEGSSINHSRPWADDPLGCSRCKSNHCPGRHTMEEHPARVGSTAGNACGTSHVALTRVQAAANFSRAGRLATLGWWRTPRAYLQKIGRNSKGVKHNYLCPDEELYSSKNSGRLMNCQIRIRKAARRGGHSIRYPPRDT